MSQTIKLEVEKNIAERFNYLEEMVTKADEYNIKLTLRFSAQWTAYIAGNPGRLAMLDEWKPVRTPDSI